MARLTREESMKMAEMMIKYDETVFQLRNNGSIVAWDVDTGEKKVVLNLIPKHKGNKELFEKMSWQQSADTLILGNERLKYKTHLSKYLYEQLNPLLKRINERLEEGLPPIPRIMQTEEFREYVKRPEIKLDQQTIEKDRLHISGNATSYVNKVRVDKITKEELLELHERVRRLALDEPKAKIKKPYKYKNYIDTQYHKYEQAYDEYTETFDKLHQLWDWKMKTHGLHEGTSDDGILNDIIYPVNHKLSAFSNRSQPMSKIKEIKVNLNRALDNLENVEDNITVIHVQL